MQTKQMTAPAEVRVKTDADGNPTGVVEAYVSVFGNVDLVGDRVVKGAFSEFVQRVKDGWRAPFVWSHKTHTPEMFIGDTIDAEETEHGLKVTAQLHMDEPVAAKVFSLIEKRQVSQYSFAYKVKEARWVDEDGKRIYELVKLDVHETGPTMFGANPETRTVTAKDLPAAEPETDPEDPIEGNGSEKTSEDPEEGNEAPQATPATAEEWQQMTDVAHAHV